MRKNKKINKLVLGLLLVLLTLFILKGIRVEEGIYTNSFQEGGKSYSFIELKEGGYVVKKTLEVEYGREVRLITFLDKVVYLKEVK